MTRSTGFLCPLVGHGSRRGAGPKIARELPAFAVEDRNAAGRKRAHMTPRIGQAEVAAMKRLAPVDRLNSRQKRRIDPF